MSSLNHYDQAARYAVKLDANGFLAWLLPGLDPDLRFARWLDTQTIPFPGDPDRRCDTVAELVHASGLGPPWGQVLEQQTRPDPEMLDRLLEYLARLRRELRHGPHGRDRYLIAAAVINLTGPPQPDGLEMVLPGATGIELRWRIHVRTMSAENAATTLAGIENGQIARCLLPWIPLMTGGGEPAMISEWKRLALLEPNSRHRRDYGSIALIFAKLTACQKVWSLELEGWNVEESDLVKQWQDVAEQRGRLTTLRENLLRVLVAKFSGPLPSELLAAIQTQPDFGELSRWFDVALKAASLAEFQASVQVPQTA